MLDFITQNIGSKFVEPPVLRLDSILEDATKRSPLIFILSPGVDPAPKLQQLADEKSMAQSRYYTLSLGQGQAVAARKLLEEGMKKVSRDDASPIQARMRAFRSGPLDISCELPSVDQLVARVGEDRRTIANSSRAQRFPPLVELVANPFVSHFDPADESEDNQ